METPNQTLTLTLTLTLTPTTHHMEWRRSTKGYLSGKCAFLLISSGRGCGSIEPMHTFSAEVVVGLPDEL